MQRTLLTAVVSAVIFTTLSCAPVEAGRQTMGPAGGSITLRSGLTVQVPEGALEREVEVHVRDIALGRGEHEVELEPHGTVLKVPGILSVDDDGRRVEALELEHGLLGVHRHGARVEVELSRLGRVSLRRFDDSSWADGGVDDHGRGGRGADDSSDAGDDHGRGGHGADDSPDAGDDRGGLRDGGASGVAGAACVDDDTCPCGSECVTGFCTAVVTCTTTADCATGLTCREGRRHGQACGVLACNP